MRQDPDLNLIHRRKDCHATTAGRSKELMDEFFSKTKTSVAKVVRCVDERTHNPQQGRFAVILKDRTKVTSLGYFGSDHSALSATEWDLLSHYVPEIKCTIFGKPMKLEPAIGGTS